MRGRGKPSTARQIAFTVAIGSMVLFAWGVTWAAGPDNWLITPEEAALPPAPADARQLGGGAPFDIGREPLQTGPDVNVVTPGAGDPSKSPLQIVVEFKPNGAPVDFSTLKVVLLKFFNIDITDRVLPYADSDGIHVPDAKLPSGEHTIRITVGDKDGGVTEAEVIIKVL